MSNVTKTNQVLRMAEICHKTGLSRSTIHDLISRGLFPRSFKLVPGGRAAGWFESEIDEYLRTRATNSHGRMS